MRSVRTVRDHMAAAHDVLLSVSPSKTFAVMGLTRRGRSRLIRCLTRLIERPAGSQTVDGRAVTALHSKRPRDFRRNACAIVFDRPRTASPMSLAG